MWELGYITTDKQNLREWCQTSKALITMRVLWPFLAICAILLSSVLSLPDAHAEGGESFAHVADNVADNVVAHGADHFDTEDPEPDHQGQDHSSTHHHNCSFSLANSGPLMWTTFWRLDGLKGPLTTSSLASLAPELLIEPPKA